MKARYDLAVIGSGPAGQKAAIQAAKLRKRVAIIDRPDSCGGMCVHHGAIPSKTLREAILVASGFHHRQTNRARRRRNLTMQDLMERCEEVIEHEVSVVLSQLERNDVDMLRGEAAFVDAHSLRIGGRPATVSANYIIIATGTMPARPATIPFEDGLIVDANGLGTFGRVPRSLVVVGAGVIGTEYASMLALLNVDVTLVDQNDRLLRFVDPEIAEALSYHMRDVDVTLRLGEEVVGIRKTAAGKVLTTLKSGKKIVADALLYAVGRQGATARLGLERIGIATDGRGRITVNDRFQTGVGHIYAVGDVIGYPSLASTAMEQGRLAACHAFGVEAVYRPELIPYGIYSVPEISMVGQNEKQLTADGVPYEVGIARYREIARGQILGDRVGMLKLLFHRETRRLLGVHAIGQGATELIHIGQMALTFNAAIDVFIENAFNYPTLAECYRVAALDGHNKVTVEL